MPEPKLTPKQQVFVAAYIGEAHHNATEAARIAGYTHPDVQGPRLLGNVRIQEAVQTHLAEVKEEAKSAKQSRLDGYQDRRRRMLLVIEERAEELKAIPGGRSGLLVKQYRGDHPQYALDTGLLRELRELDKQEAQELGEWVEKGEQAITGAGGVPLTVVIAERSDGPQ